MAILAVCQSSRVCQSKLRHYHRPQTLTTIGEKRRYDYSSNTLPNRHPGTPWGDAERAEWLSRQTRQRSYEAEVLSVIEGLRSRFDVEEYGALDYGPDYYPLMAIRSRGWNNDLPLVLITGGVHGYETSGVHGALQFLDKHAADYAGRVNLLVAPVSVPGRMSAFIAGTIMRLIPTVHSTRAVGRRSQPHLCDW